MKPDGRKWAVASNCRTEQYLLSVYRDISESMCNKYGNVSCGKTPLKWPAEEQSRIHVFRMLAVVTISADCVMFKWRLSQFPESRQTECNACFVRNLFSDVYKQSMMLGLCWRGEGGTLVRVVLLSVWWRNKLFLCYLRIWYLGFPVWHVWTERHKIDSDTCESSSTNTCRMRIQQHETKALNMWIQQSTTQAETCESNSAKRSPSAQTRHARESNDMGHKLKRVNPAAQNTNWIIREFKFRLNMFLNLSIIWVGWSQKYSRVSLCVVCCWILVFHIMFCALGFSCFISCFVLLDIHLSIVTFLPLWRRREPTAACPDSQPLAPHLSHRIQCSVTATAVSGVARWSDVQTPAVNWTAQLWPRFAQKVFPLGQHSTL